MADIPHQKWLQPNLEQQALQYAASHIVPEHYQQIKQRRQHQADKMLQAVHERLVKEIQYWSEQYIKLKDEAEAGKQPKVQPENTRRTVDELNARLEQRRQELNAMKDVVSATPVVIGGALVVPHGLLDQRQGQHEGTVVDAQARARVEALAMQAVIAAEEQLGHTVFDVSADKCGWDITARPPADAQGALQQDRHIEVKGRAQDQTTLTISRNEIIYALNQADKFWLAIVLVDGASDACHGPYYVKNPFISEPEFGVASITYNLEDLLAKAVAPEATL